MNFPGAQHISSAGSVSLPHPRSLGWYGTVALAMGGSNQSLFIIAALFVGQGDILGQGSAAIPLLIVGLLLSWAAAPGWTELVLMFPNRVGGISSSCAEAFRPYSAVLANLTGVCYWWGWVPTCGLTAILSASAIHHWYLPDVPVNLMAIGLVVLFTCVNLAGIKWVSRFAIPFASTSALLAFISGLGPIVAGEVDWRQATTFELTTPFSGWFGGLTSLMAGLYLIGFAAPAFEAAACHVGETVNPNKNVPRAMLVSALLAGLYFIVLPLVWLGTIGPKPLGQDLALVLGPTFAPVFGNAGKAAAIWFMVFSMFSGTLQPLAGAARTLAQLAEDGLLPRSFALRSRTDAPWVATILTASMSTLFLLIGDPIWLIAAANFTYLIGIALPSVAVWILRKDSPELPRPYRAPRGTITLGLIAAVTWGISALLGFEQFGLPTVVVGLVFAYAGSALYAWRRYSDRRREGLPGVLFGLQLKLTGAMLLVLLLDGFGYLLAVNNLPHQDSALLTGLSDIFVAVAILTIAVALVLPGMIAHSALQVSNAAKQLVDGTLADFTHAMLALGKGDIEAAHARFAITPVRIRTRDELGEMADSFNALQVEIGNAAVGLDGAREGLRQARSELTGVNINLVQRIKELHLAEEKISGILESIDNIVWSLLAGSHETLYVNAAVETILGRPVADFEADKKLWMKAIHSDDQPLVRAWLSKLLPQRASASLQYRIVRPNGEIRWLENKARLVCDEKGMPIRVDGVSSDISDHKLRDAKISHMANHDYLTGLPNRNLLNDRISQALSQAARTKKNVGLLFLDLDGFKFINDSFGHTLGDALLKNISGRLTGAVRAGDTVARLGGDEFVVMLLDITTMQDVANIADKILQALALPLSIDGRELHVTASIGASMYPRDGENYEVLLQHADIAMYNAKQHGRNRLQFYTPEMSAQTDERVELETAMRQAISSEQFELYYQPQIDLRNGKIVSLEALIRWHHPQLGSITPARFIPLAEETGLILPIGEWVLRTACKQLKAWHDSGYSDLSVAVNISARQFQHDDMPKLIQQILNETGAQPTFLHLELTESVILQNSDVAIESLRKLKALGIVIALDDFGTGYSSLSYLKRFPIDIIKIDQSFTADLSSSKDASSIILAIIAMARSLNIKTVAEGVENQVQMDFLKENGCDVVQGYYFSRAISACDMTIALRKDADRVLVAVDIDQSA